MDQVTMLLKIKEFVETNGIRYRKWYIGITNDIDRRFEEHKINYFPE